MHRAILLSGFSHAFEVEFIFDAFGLESFDVEEVFALRDPNDYRPEKIIFNPEYEEIIVI